MAEVSNVLEMKLMKWHTAYFINFLNDTDTEIVSGRQ